MRFDATELVIIGIHLHKMIEHLKEQKEFWTKWEPRIARQFDADIDALTKLETCFEKARAVDIKPLEWKEAIRHE